MTMRYAAIRTYIRRTNQLAMSKPWSCQLILNVIYHCINQLFLRGFRKHSLCYVCIFSYLELLNELFFSKAIFFWCPDYHLSCFSGIDWRLKIRTPPILLFVCGKDCQECSNRLYWPWDFRMITVIRKKISCGFCLVRKSQPKGEFRDENLF